MTYIIRHVSSINRDSRNQSVPLCPKESFVMIVSFSSNESDRITVTTNFIESTIFIVSYHSNEPMDIGCIIWYQRNNNRVCNMIFWLIRKDRQYPNFRENHKHLYVSYILNESCKRLYQFITMNRSTLSKQYVRVES